MIGVGVIVCLWLQRYYSDQWKRANDLLGDMGFVGEEGQENRQAPDRLLEEAGFREVSLGKFLHRLETEPIAPVWHECGRQYYRKVLGGESSKPPPDKWPAYLGPE